ncbi:MAG: type II secretion system F family protein [Gammaproteobacteria bacterium]|nr:type II secretion system F family protein [Gammaproteobacteria bacterium]
MNGFALESPQTLMPLAVTFYFLLSILLMVAYVTYRRKQQRLSVIKTAFQLQGVPSKDGNSLSDTVNHALKELKTVRNKKQKSGFSLMLLSAGVEMSTGVFVSMWALSFGVVVGVALWLDLPNIVVMALGASLVFAPLMVLKAVIKSRKHRFLDEFSGAIDVIVRGVRIGLSVGGCFRLVAEEGSEAVRGEFARIQNDIDLGLSVTEALERFSERVSLPEVRFFTIVVTAQAQTGGNLSQPLENLSKLLRERKLLIGKIRALSAEAKTSAWIIGALPVVVMGAVNFLSPDYTTVLFATFKGQLILGGALMWMVVGIFVMTQMINLET